MLNFRRTNIALVIVLVIMVIVNRVYSIPLYSYAIVLFVYSLLLFYGSYYVGSNFFMKVLCHGASDKPQIAISFDDGPAAAYTSEVLTVLQELQVPAIFFCIGKNIRGNEKLLGRMITEGHIIGNHSYSHHFWFDLFSTNKMQNDIASMSAETKVATGIQPLLFRPPYGVTTPNMREVMDKDKLTAIGWTVRSLDTSIHDEQKLLDRIMQGLHPGAIVLLHDTSKTTLAILPKFIQLAREKGYQFVRADKLLNVRAYA